MFCVAGWSSPVARQAHNLKVVGSNPTPATNIKTPVENLGWRSTFNKDKVNLRPQS